MAQFTLNWDATDVIASSNANEQIVSYRRKSTGGAYTDTGFTPVNPLPKNATTVLSPVTYNNIIYEFKVECNCTSNGPSIDDNGVVEKLGFSCIVPTITVTDTTATIVFDVSNTDITKMKITTYLASNTVAVPIMAALRINNSIVFNLTGLVASTNYYLKSILLSVVNYTEISSLGTTGVECGNYVFMTNAVPVCGANISLTISSIEI